MGWFSSAGRPRIILTMIVKNEAHCIRRCLESVKPYIDAWSIADTGSTDGTQALVREILGNIPGELLERPWQDFAANRNEAIDAGLRFSPDYFLTLDADEELTVEPGFSLSGLSADCYQFNFQIGGSVRWPRNALFRPDIRYRYVLDETLDLTDKRVELLPACLVLSHSDGARSSDGLVAKYERDCEVLRRAVEKEPGEPRYWFYLGNRLFGAGKFEDAIVALRRRIELGGGLQAELGHSWLLIGQCLENLGRPVEEVAAAYRSSFQANPNRAEPLFALGCLHSIQGEHALAEVFARAAQRIPRPQEQVPCDESVYAFRAVDLLAGALAEQGKLSEARDLLEKLINLPQLPECERERVSDNIATIRKAEGDPKPKSELGPDEATYENQAAALRARGPGAFRRMALEYLASFQAQALPSPVRWLWIALVALFGKWASAVGALASVAILPWAIDPLVRLHPAVLCAVASPLLFLVGRRRFQDGPVAALTLLGLGFASRGEPIGLAVAAFALLGIKEASVLVLPALFVGGLVAGSDWAQLAIGLGSGALAACAALLVLFGETAWPMLRAGAAGHRTPYTKDHQSGAWHRLVADLVLVSPATTLLGLAGPWQLVAVAAALVAAHTIAPVRNVRLVVAADLLLRASAAVAFGWWVLPLAAIDIYIARRLSGVYDPVTQALTSQLGMSR